MKLIKVKCKDEREGSAMIATANGMRPYKKGYRTPEEAMHALMDLEERDRVPEMKYGVYVFRNGDWEIWEG